MSNKSGISDQVISLPKGGGAMQGIGEKFSPDLHTGTGNFTIPISLPPGRNGFQPQLNLVYSTGNGNGAWGLGWYINIPGVSRQTNKGVPRYDDARDTFVLSGAEDLVPVEQLPGLFRYQPRTEGMFAKILHHADAQNNYWEVKTKDGLVSQYGTAASAGKDPAVIADPVDPNNVFTWHLTETTDPFGNRITYTYERDERQTDGPHHWDQLYLSEIRYVDYGDPSLSQFLIRIKFNYEQRPDPFSEYRAGFNIRTVRRCTNIEIFTQPGGVAGRIRTYRFIYLDQQGLPAALPLNGVSLLSKVLVEGHNDAGSEQLPPLEFSYSSFEPEKRVFFPVTGPDMPPGSLARPEYELADLFGDGLPDILQMDETVRYWRNLGNGRFDRPRLMQDAPAGLRLADAGVQLIDANGEGRIDLLVTGDSLNGYFPLRFEGEWDRRSFRRYEIAPSFNLEDPEVKLVDLTGDGVTDAIRSGSRMECYFNDPLLGWKETRWVEYQSPERFPNVSFSDTRIKWGDMSGDGLQDIVMVHDGKVEYWPNLGYGNWGPKIAMRNSPRFNAGYDPKRILVGDIDGDGLSDIVYVDNNHVIIWINQSGNGWSNPVEIRGTPPVAEMDAVRLADLLGTGIDGILWSMDAGGQSRDHMFFLHLTGSIKPYLLTQMDNHMGALTKVEYASSINFYLADARLPATRWKTSLPFPVQVVAKVEVTDHFSKGTLNTSYHYHHGYWDGAEREFRGFGRVDQRDTENVGQIEKAAHLFSPPLETRTWFHQGPVGDESGDWKEVDHSDEYWQGDPQLLSRPEPLQQLLRSFPRRAKRDAFRALRSNILRTELYAIDGSELQHRPYTVTEFQFGVREEFPGVFFPFALAQRTAQWERGDEPMHRFSFMGEYDASGQLLFQANITVPRNRDFRTPVAVSDEIYLGTCTGTTYIKRQEDQPYIADRVARVTNYEILNDGRSSIFQLWEKVQADSSVLKVIGQTINFYDGEAFTGLPFQQAGAYGALVRSESLVLTKDILEEAWRSDDGAATAPPYLVPGAAPVWTADYPEEFRTLPPLAGYVFHDGGAGEPYTSGYFVITERRSYDFQDPAGEKRGLTATMRNALGQDTTVIYNEPGHPYHLLPAKVVDPAGLSMQVAYNYQVLQPHEITDRNNNQSTFHFTPLGFLQSSFVKGKGHEGDQQRPGLSLEYGLLAFENSDINNRQPVFVRTIRRMHHDTEIDIPQPDRDETIMTVEYSDGFGRLLQTRTQAESIVFGDTVFGGNVLPVDQADTADTGNDIPGVQTDPAHPQVVVSGWQVYDNKGQVIAKYEPFFSSGWDYTPLTDAEKGKRVIMQYDPRGQIVRTIHPGGAEQQVIYGKPSDPEHPGKFAPSPWEAYTYDANDSAVRTHPGDPVTEQYRHHWNTPANIVIDALGRTVQAVSRHREAVAGADGLPPAEIYTTNSVYDIRGNILTITDALHRVAFRHVYDLANQKLRVESIDAGIRREIRDAMGNPVEQRDNRNALALHHYDMLNRPVRLWARDKAGQPISLREHLVYGDSPEAGFGSAERETLNLSGKLYQYYDEAGLVTFNRYDFKGNLLERSRRLIRDQVLLDVFNNAAANNWQAPAWRADWQPAGNDLAAHANTLLETESYVTTTSYDGLNRVKALQYPKTADGHRKTLRPGYNRAGALAKVALDDMPFVEQVAYNAKGQRVLIAYGNKVITRYAYDPETFRLARMRSERYSLAGSSVYHPEGPVLQDMAYEYDLVGNVMQIKDRTPGSGMPDSMQGANALDRHFMYDSLYRLRSATGRECDHPPELPWDNTPRCSDLTRTRSYKEQYLYDAADNIEGIKHTGGDGTFLRNFQLVPGCNRIHKIIMGQTASECTYDLNGNMTSETLSRHFEWNYADRMRVFRIQAGTAEPSVHAQYLYDAGGQRIKKLVRRQGGKIAVTVYIDGIFEHQRISQHGAIHENNTLHIIDNQARIALLRIGDPFPDDTTPALTYYLGDHLGSSNVVVDNAGNWMNREEYTSYGETSFGGFARKRYQFTGKERDEESGLNYHGARYYASWQGRFISTDPIGIKGGVNLYTYTRCNPLNYTDPGGTEEKAVVANGQADCSGQNHHNTKNDSTSSKGTYFTFDDSKVEGWFAGNTTQREQKAETITPANAVQGSPQNNNSHPNPQGYAILPPPVQLPPIRGGSPVSAPGPVNDVMVNDPNLAWRNYKAPGAATTGTAQAPGAAGVATEAEAASLSARAFSLVSKVVKVGGTVLFFGTMFKSDGPTPEDIEAKQEERERQLMLAGPHDHHIFPEEYREEFRKIGIDIDFYTVTIPADKHIGKNGLHKKLDYNNEWYDFFYGGEKATQEKAAVLASWLLKRAGLDDPNKYPRHPYRKPNDYVK
jgi:RHS repeat-associated protein